MAAPQQVGLQGDPMLHSAPALVATISKQPGNLLDDNRLNMLKNFFSCGHITQRESHYFVAVRTSLGSAATSIGPDLGGVHKWKLLHPDRHPLVRIANI